MDQLDKGKLDVSNPPRGGSGVPKKGKALFDKHTLGRLLEASGNLHAVANAALFLDQKDFAYIRSLLEDASVNLAWVNSNLDRAERERSRQ